MQFFDFLTLMEPQLTLSSAKIHLASHNGAEDPLDVYFAGQFEEWQSWQTKRNFEREFVVSLIAMPEAEQWLFAGLYRSQGYEAPDTRGCYYYHLSEVSSCTEMKGRAIAQFHRTSRQSYLNAENWADQMMLLEVKAEQLSIADFPGFKAVNLTFEELRLIIRQSLESWRTALSNVAGVYLISDTASGKLYVGSACGEGGIWQRWSDYAANGHGGNRELQRLLGNGHLERARAFRYSILEITDIHELQEAVLARESHWKEVLMTREHGLNAN